MATLNQRLGLGSVPPTVSGTYVRRVEVVLRGRVVELLADIVRLDVDGYFPQMMASGTLEWPAAVAGLTADWVAYKLTATGQNTWEGPIFAWWPSSAGQPVAAAPYASVRIHARPGWISSSLTIAFLGGSSEVTRELELDSPYFRTAEFEIDRVQGSARATQINPCDHPNHPADLACEPLTIADAYGRAGVDVVRSSRELTVPLSAADPATGRWTDQELNDAMYTFWSHHHAGARWALWLLFAGSYVDDTVLGIMFDHSGPYQRHGAAVFDADITAQIDTTGNANPSAELARNTFFAGVHESGHCFNLLHSWVKSKNAWLPFPMTYDEPDAESFMNYPHDVGEQQLFSMGEFYANFEYRFSNQELRFIRHAPERFVEMGEAPAASDHDLAANRPRSHDIWRLTANVARPERVFEFLEPVLLVVTLTNTSGRPRVVDAAALQDGHNLSVVIRQPGGRLRAWVPYMQRCRFARPRILQPGERLQGWFFVSAGVPGWDLAEPGAYELDVTLHTGSVVAHAAPLKVRIAYPRSWDEEVLAQDLFTDQVARALAFGGTLAMSSAIAALEAAAERLARRAIARHARLALGLSLVEPRKLLRATRDGFDHVEARVEDARRLLDSALLADRDAAIATFGEIAYDRYLEDYAQWLERHGDAAGAKKARGGQPAPRATGSGS